MIDHLSDLDFEQRTQFLFDLSLLGQAVERACRPHDLRRVNYEILGNSLPVLHGHVHARCDWEPPELIGRPVWLYPQEVRNAEEHVYDDAKHGKLRAAITAELNALSARAYNE